MERGAFFQRGRGPAEGAGAEYNRCQGEAGGTNRSAPADTPTPPAHVIRRLLDALHSPRPELPVDPDAKIMLYRNLLADRRVLVLLENARSSSSAPMVIIAGIRAGANST